jgi:hypothetical protein
MQSIGSDVGFLKMGLLGFAGSGKTYTAIKVALGVREHFGLKGPIAFFDTEGGSRYIAPMVKSAGAELVGLQSRSFDASVKFLRDAKSEGCAVAIVDSVTHTWRELCSSYLVQKNVAREKAKKPKQSRIEFPDMVVLKDKWAVFSDLFLTSDLHTIICGRAGFEWDFEENDDGKKELVKTGIKMKTEGEFGFEASLLVEMERVQNVDSRKRLVSTFTRRATILKDRFSVIDGKTFDDPTFESFLPHVALLQGEKGTNKIDTETQSDLAVDATGEAAWAAEKKYRTIYCEEVQGLLLSAFPGMSTDDKKAKADLAFEAFGTRSWEAIQGMNSNKIKAGLDSLPALIAKKKGA